VKPVPPVSPVKPVPPVDPVNPAQSTISVMHATRKQRVCETMQLRLCSNLFVRPAQLRNVH
jgi:hypothetical protein